MVFLLFSYDFPMNHLSFRCPPAPWHPPCGTQWHRQDADGQGSGWRGVYPLTMLTFSNHLNHEVYHGFTMFHHICFTNGFTTYVDPLQEISWTSPWFLEPVPVTLPPWRQAGVPFLYASSASFVEIFATCLVAETGGRKLR